MKFYCLIESPKNDWARDLFQKACMEKSVEYVEISVNLSKLDFPNLPKLLLGDCLYRVSANNQNAKKAEYSLAESYVSTFYSTPDNIYRPASGLKLARTNIPIPKTIPILTHDRDLLKTFAENLGGFPVILKAMGGKEGVGVMRIDSLESLCSIADYLSKTNGNFILRKYIDVRESLRLVVLDGKVIAGMKYKASHQGDFRSNRKTRLNNVEIFKKNDSIEKVAVSAVKAMGLEFGGVDILLDEKNDPYVLEVNFPCNFGETQEFTGVDVAGLMVDYLKNKAANLIGK